MKRFVLFIALTLVQVSLMMGQWTSPGNGTVYSLRDLAEVSDGCVTYEENLNAYLIHADLTISPNDRLEVVLEDFGEIDADAVAILCEGDILITVKGSFWVNPSEELDVYIEPRENNHLSMRLEQCTGPCLFANTKFFYLSGIQVINSEVTFDDCLFQSFDMQYSTGAIHYENCSPTLKNCIFQGNYGSAINFGVNTKGSPQIFGCEFRYNVLSYLDMPQVDLGPGADDTIRIINSKVIGLYPLEGGISVSDTMDISSSKVLLQNNHIAHNRYGYHQQGNRIDALIIDNEIECNCIDPDPVNSCSGICIHGASHDCKATIRHNLIEGNLYGVTVLDKAVVDMGTAENPGNNILYDNHNSGQGTDQAYALYVKGVNDVSAVGNYWGGSTEEFAESVIYHRPDLGEDHGLVTYSPILTQNNWEVEEEQALPTSVYPNPTRGWVTLQMEEADGFEYEVFNIQGQQVMRGHAEGSETMIDLGPLPSGIYLVALKAKQQAKPTYQRIVR